MLSRQLRVLLKLSREVEIKRLMVHKKGSIKLPEARHNFVNRM